MLTGIILAAGRGRRLGERTAGRPKCLLRVGPRTLLEHQLAALSEAGIETVVVVSGYAAEAVDQALAGHPPLLLRNPRHQETNSLYSLWLARDYARDGFVLLNADVLFDPDILQQLLASPHPDALAVERRRQFEAEEMKVELEGERVLALGKTLPLPRAHAENLGIVKFSPLGAQVLFARMEALLQEGAETEMCPYAFHSIAATHPLYAVPIEGLPWIEIDFVEDLIRAREHIWPAILQRQRRPAVQPAAPEPHVIGANPSTVLGD